MELPEGASNEEGRFCLMQVQFMQLALPTVSQALPSSNRNDEISIR